MNDLINKINNIFNLLSSDFFKDAFFFAKNLFLFLDIILIVVSVYIFIEALSLRPKFISSLRIKKINFSSKSSFNVVGRWQKIIENTSFDSLQSMFLAIIEADKLIDEVLENLGFSGESIAEKLEKLKVEEFKSLDDLWQAHKVRNEIVHTPNFIISKSEAKKILEAYERFLKEIGAI